MADAPPSLPFAFTRGDHWQERLKFIVQTMREMSSATDPETMVQTYGETRRDIVPSERFVALSRRELERLMTGAQKVKCSAFATEMIKRMG